MPASYRMSIGNPGRRRLLSQPGRGGIAGGGIAPGAIAGRVVSALLAFVDLGLALRPRAGA